MIVTVFLALACVVALGSVLVYLFPDVQIDRLRQNLNRLVLDIFLPALNFQVIYTATIGLEFWELPVAALTGVFVSLVIGSLAYALFTLEGRSKGALILACAFSNVTYFGIAVLQGLFPHNTLDVLKVAVLFEITITPLNLIVGSALAAYFGNRSEFSLKKSALAIAKMPLLWTTFLALALNLLHIAVPQFILHGTSLLASAVSGLMILSLGMALKYPILKRSLPKLHILIPVLLIKLLISPLVVLFVVHGLHVQMPYSQAAIIEGAMPSQLITLAIVDRFNLDIEILAIAISLDTVVSFFTIPVIHSLLN